MNAAPRPHAAGHACPAAEFLDAAPRPRGTPASAATVIAEAASRGFRHACWRCARRQEEAPEMTLEDEMNRLLGELSNKR